MLQGWNKKRKKNCQQTCRAFPPEPPEERFFFQTSRSHLGRPLPKHNSAAAPKYLCGERFFQKIQVFRIEQINRRVFFFFFHLSICTISSQSCTRNGSSLTRQCGCGSDLKLYPRRKSDFTPISLPPFIQCTPACSHVQAWLFSNIICKEIALLLSFSLSFFFANGLHPCVSCIPSRPHDAQQEKKEKEAERSRCVVQRSVMNEIKTNKNLLKAVFGNSYLTTSWPCAILNYETRSCQFITMKTVRLFFFLTNPRSRSYWKKEILNSILTHEFSNRASAAAEKKNRRIQLLPRYIQGAA